MRLGAVLLLMISLAGFAQGGSPAEAVSAAAQDLAKQPEHIRPYLRYLSLYAIPQKQREEFRKVFTFHVNSLSREAEFSHPRLVTPDLLALNYRDYAWDPAVWERLASVDPYFHQKVTLQADAVVKTVWPGDAQYRRGRYTEEKKKGETIDVAAPWLPTKDILYLREQTYSEAPVLRADWFFVQTAIQLGRVAGYYDWLGLGKKEADFEKLIGANQAESRRLKKEIAASLARSGVTLQNRAVLRLQSLTGAYWITQDFKTSVKAQNVLRLLDQDRDPPQGDASERYGVLPNGLFAFWLQDAQGNRQDTAPDFIASDGSASGLDRRIHIGRSCIVCHVEGIRPVDDYIRRIYRGAITLQSPDYDKFVRLRQLYLSDLERQVKRDQADYAERLLALNGTKPAEIARAYGRVWDEYVEKDLGPAEFARELGIEEKTLLVAFKKYASAPPEGVGSIDVVIAGLIQVPPVRVRREHVEEIYGTAQNVIRGYVPAEPIEKPRGG